MKLIIILLLMIAGSAASADHLTEPQKDLIRTAIYAEPSLATAIHTAQDYLIAEWLNADSSPPFYVWKSTVTRSDILTSQSVDGTTFSWAGSGYISRSQGERDAFREIFTSSGYVVPTAPNVISAFNDIFSGAGGASNRAHVTSIGKRVARRYEAILAVGPGTLASPATMTIEGTISVDDAGRTR